MIGGTYILRGHRVVKAKTILEWGKFFQDGRNRIVKYEVLHNGYRVSTVFLGLDHNFMGGKPLLFETMVFGSDGELDMKRYATWKEAETGHKIMVGKWLLEKRIKK